MNFKEALEEDKSVFLNTDEFGEEHDINGTVYNVIVQAEYGRSSKYGGVNNNQKIIYISETDIERPVRNSVMYFDDEVFLIKNAELETGMYKITLEIDES